MSHLKSLAAPKNWPIKRKENIWVVRPMSGAHSKEYSIPLVVVLRNVLGLLDTKKEVKFVIREGLVKVNGRKVKDVKLPVGLFDVISLDKEKKYYRIVMNKRKRLVPIEVDEKEANLIPLKIENKRILTKDKIQFNFTNGWNLTLKDKKYSTRDTLIFDVKSNKIVNHIPFDKGNVVFVFGGKHVGELAKIQKVNDKVSLKNSEKEWEGIKDYAFVIGKKDPVIKVREK